MSIVTSYTSIQMCIRYITWIFMYKLCKTEQSAKRRREIEHRLLALMKQKHFDDISITELCDLLSCSKSTLIKLFKEECGVTVGSYITDMRIAEAERLLLESDASINEIARAGGFCDQSYSSKVFVTKHGVPPTDYRNTRKGE